MKLSPVFLFLLLGISFCGVDLSTRRSTTITDTPWTNTPGPIASSTSTLTSIISSTPTVPATSTRQSPAEPSPYPTLDLSRRPMVWFAPLPRIIRIETTESPSWVAWREIEVIAAR